MSDRNEELCRAPQKKIKFIERNKCTNCKKRLFSELEYCDNPITEQCVIIKNYTPEKQIIEEQVYKIKYRKIYGANQLHEEYTEILPCGEGKRSFADDAPEDYHDVLYHSEECDGEEHFTTCQLPADPLMGIWSRRCTRQCPQFEQTAQKVRTI